MKRTTIGQWWYEIQRSADDAFLEKFPKTTILKVENFCETMYKKLIKDMSKAANSDFSDCDCEAILPKRLISVEFKEDKAYIYNSERKIGKALIISNIKDAKTFERVFQIVLKRIDEELALYNLELYEEDVWEITFSFC